MSAKTNKNAINRKRNKPELNIKGSFWLYKNTFQNLLRSKSNIFVRSLIDFSFLHGSKNDAKTFL